MRMTQKTLLTTHATYLWGHVARMTFVQKQLSVFGMGAGTGVLPIQL
jgi:hypothetical protein